MMKLQDLNETRAATAQEIADGAAPFDLQAKINIANVRRLTDLNAKIKYLANQPVTSSSNKEYDKALQERIVLREEMA